MYIYITIVSMHIIAEAQKVTTYTAYSRQVTPCHNIMALCVNPRRPKQQAVYGLFSSTKPTCKCSKNYLQIIRSSYHHEMCIAVKIMCEYFPV